MLGLSKAQSQTPCQPILTSYNPQNAFREEETLAACLVLTACLH